MIREYEEFWFKGLLEKPHFPCSGFPPLNQFKKIPIKLNEQFDSEHLIQEGITLLENLSNQLKSEIISDFSENQRNKIVSNITYSVRLLYAFGITDFTETIYSELNNKDVIDKCITDLCIATAMRGDKAQSYKYLNCDSKQVNIYTKARCSLIFHKKGETTFAEELFAEALFDFEADRYWRKGSWGAILLCYTGIINNKYDQVQTILKKIEDDYVLVEAAITVAKLCWGKGLKQPALEAIGLACEKINKISRDEDGTIEDYVQEIKQRDRALLTTLEALCEFQAEDLALEVLAYVDRSPVQIRSHILVADMYLSMGRPPEARNLLEIAKSLCAYNFETFVEEVSQTKIKNTTNSILKTILNNSEFEAAVGAFNNSYKVMLIIARSFRFEGRNKEAKLYYLQAYENAILAKNSLQAKPWDVWVVLRELSRCKQFLSVIRCLKATDDPRDRLFTAIYMANDLIKYNKINAAKSILKSCHHDIEKIKNEDEKINSLIKIAMLYMQIGEAVNSKASLKLAEFYIGKMDAKYSSRPHDGLLTIAIINLIIGNKNEFDRLVESAEALIANNIVHDELGNDKTLKIIIKNLISASWLARAYIVSGLTLKSLFGDKSIPQQTRDFLFKKPDYDVALTNNTVM